MISKRMDVVRICDAMGWDYETYSNQPNWFIELVIRKRNADNEDMERRQKPRPR